MVTILSEQYRQLFAYLLKHNKTIRNKLQLLGKTVNINYRTYYKNDKRLLNKIVQYKK